MLKNHIFICIYQKKAVPLRREMKKHLVYTMSKGQYAVVSPELTGLSESIKGEIINIRQNPFIGPEIAVRDETGRVFFGESKYFTAI